MEKVSCCEMWFDCNMLFSSSDHSFIRTVHNIAYQKEKRVCYKYLNAYAMNIL